MKGKTINFQILFNIFVIIIICVGVYLYFQNKKESFEGITGTSFVSRVPKGTIVAYNGTVAPAGWAICNGDKGTPNLRGRFIRMASEGLSFDNDGYAFDNVVISDDKTRNYSGEALNNSLSSLIGNYKFGEKGGSDKIRLTDPAQLPSHNHNIYGQSVVTGGNGLDSGNSFRLSGGDTSSTGSSAHIPNVPPFYTLVYIMKL